MRVTEKKLKANRENAVKHSFYVPPMVINSPEFKEDKAAFDRLVADLHDELHPNGLLEEILVDKIANYLWLRQRAIAAETAQISRQLDNVDDEVEAYLAEQRQLGIMDQTQIDSPENLERVERMIIGINCIPNGPVADNIASFENRIDRQLDLNLRTLLRLQNNRRSKSDNEKQRKQSKMSIQSQISSNTMEDNNLQDMLLN
jgi:hypothetical protein